jgi:hypothetical protein
MTHVQDAAEIQASRYQIMTVNDKSSIELLASKVMEPHHKMKALPPQIEMGGARQEQGQGGRCHVIKMRLARASSSPKILAWEYALTS